MHKPPVFPHFKPIALGDKTIFQERLWAYQPETSELTFTNLYMWSGMTHAQWCTYQSWLLLVCRDSAGCTYALPPIGPPPRWEATVVVLDWLREQRREADPRIERADRRLVQELAGTGACISEPVRDHFDYLYSRRDLAALSGRKYHARKNHVNRFARAHAFEYASLDDRHRDMCLAIQDDWCRAHRCCGDIGLTGEWDAIRRAFAAYEELGCIGGVILVEGAVQAFTFGEMLNEETAVVHIEKANPNMPDLYAVINQQFCEQGWRMVRFVNREQDLGDAGLRQAKLAYHPERLVEKFRIRPA